MGKNYLYIPYGPDVASHQFAGEIIQLARQQGSIFIKAEPMQDDVAQQLVSLGFRKSSKSIQPRKTVVIDLTKSEDELLGAMHHKTRYNIRVAERHGIHVRTSDDLFSSSDVENFWRLMQKTTARDKFNSYPRSYYEQLATNFSYGKFIAMQLWFAYHQDIPVAAAMILTHGDRACYLHGASDHAYRALMAPYALHWNIIKMFHVSGFMFYDLWGVDAQKWPGVTRFKLGWDGRTVEYPGAFDMICSRPWYLAYRMASKFYEDYVLRRSGVGDGGELSARTFRQKNSR